jgi:hypothetical protein
MNFNTKLGVLKSKSTIIIHDINKISGSEMRVQYVKRIRFVCRTASQDANL